MEVQFTHTCGHCNRRLRLNVDRLGVRVACPNCNRASEAVDSHGESLALDEPIKHFAELADIDERSEWETHRTPR